MLYVWCVCCVVVWQRVIGLVCVICGYGQRVIGIVCVLCSGVAACYRYGACTQCLCGIVIGMVRVMCGGVAACHMYGACTCGGVAAGHTYVACTVWWFGSVS